MINKLEQITHLLKETKVHEQLYENQNKQFQLH